jgi:hypothetical protein
VDGRDKPGHDGWCILDVEYRVATPRGFNSATTVASIPNFWNGDKRMLVRPQNVAIVIALVLCLATAIGGEILEASNSPHASVAQKMTEQINAGADFHTQNESAEEAIARYNKWLTIFTAVLAVATVGLGFATAGLYVAGERHSERELRAYIVGTTSAQIRSFINPRPTVVLTFRNSGQTPAHDVCVWTSSAIAVYPMENPPVRPDGVAGEGGSVGIVGPHADFHNEIESDVEVTAAERAEVIAGRAAFYIYGEISYHDSFGKERTSTFCHFYAGERARGSNGILGTYHRWNRAS